MFSQSLRLYFLPFKFLLIWCLLITLIVVILLSILMLCTLVILSFVPIVVLRLIIQAPKLGDYLSRVQGDTAWEQVITRDLNNLIKKIFQLALVHVRQILHVCQNIWLYHLVRCNRTYNILGLILLVLTKILFLTTRPLKVSTSLYCKVSRLVLRLSLFQLCGGFWFVNFFILLFVFRIHLFVE